MATVSPTPEVLLRDVHELLTCCACRNAPLSPPVYACRQGHATCASCRLLVNHQCRDCNEPLAVRHLPLEEILLTAFYNESNDLIVLDEAKSEEEEKFLESRRAETIEHVENVVAQDCYEQMLGSGRTVRCPFPCDMRVTAPGLYRHFGFKHPEVFVGMLCKNNPYSITIPYDRIAKLDDENPTRCVFIFVVDIGDGEQKDEDKFRLTELNTMHAAELLNISHNMRHMLRRHKYLAMLSVGRLSQSQALTVWMTALYHFSPVTYTLKYNCESNCVSYQGRPKSLHLPMDLWDGGLVLPPALLARNPEGLELTIVFHLNLPFPLGCDLEKEPEVEPSKPLFRHLCDA